MATLRSYAEWKEDLAKVQNPNWYTKEEGWFDLAEEHQIDAELTGIYIIFFVDVNDCVRPVDVGHGVLATRIAAHRNDAALNEKYPNLKVTWTEIPNEGHRASVERYLQCRLEPLENKPKPMAIDLPFEEE